jgi:Zn-dependent M28 family amino/carboxypeptidase
MNKRNTILYLAGIGFLLMITVGWYSRALILDRNSARGKFDGARAFADLQAQVAFGPRTPGSEAHARALTWMQNKLESAGWQASVQESESMGHPVQNLVARRTDAAPQFILGAHYDSRIYADRDPDPAKWTQPVPGADDGASGVAVLLELARTLPEDGVPIWLVFFDVEDNGDIPGWDWLLGSQAFVTALTAKPQAMILVDMVGDTDLNVPMEANSDPALRTSIWDTAAQLGYGDIFTPVARYYIEDDHIPFIQAGIPAVDIIDINYTYWHTTSDTPDHTSAGSLQIVGDVLLTWLNQQNRVPR